MPSIMLEGGGELRCDRHNFKTTNVDDWNNHWDDGDHYDIVTTVCRDCGQGIEVTIPYVRIAADGSKTANMPILRCEECEGKYSNKVTVKKLSKVTDTKGDIV